MTLLAGEDLFDLFRTFEHTGGLKGSAQHPVNPCVARWILQRKGSLLRYSWLDGCQSKARKAIPTVL